MLIIGGVNVFPSQVEHVLMNVPGLADQYQLVLSHEELDRMTVKAEAKKECLRDPKLTSDIQRDLLAVLGIRVQVELVEEGALPRSEGKARRVLDLRPKE
jgi:phenylacetate-CoA ligase